MSEEELIEEEKRLKGLPQAPEGADSNSIISKLLNISIQKFDINSTKYSKKLLALTKWLIGLTIGLIFLTITTLIVSGYQAYLQIVLPKVDAQAAIAQINEYNCVKAQNIIDESDYLTKGSPAHIIIDPFITDIYENKSQFLYEKLGNQKILGLIETVGEMNYANGLISTNLQISNEGVVPGVDNNKTLIFIENNNSNLVDYSKIIVNHLREINQELSGDKDFCATSTQFSLFIQ